MPIGMQASAPRRVERLMINLDTAMPMMCAWDTCDRYARTPYQVRVHEHAGTCNSEVAMYGRHTHFVFCCEGHLGYWVDSSGARALELAARRGGKILGNRLPGATGRRYS
jgi:hypothetical protein